MSYKFCVIPAYNEQKNIGAVINQIKPYVDEVIVVDDCSIDQTAQTARMAGAIVLRHLINRGQGAALRTGTKYALTRSQADSDLIIHFDADGQMRTEDIAVVSAPLISREAEIVFGSRFLNKTTKLPLFKKIIIMPLARLTNRWLFNISLTDPQSGFRAFTVSVGRRLNWQQDGMAHCSEILSLAHRLKLNIKEAPITVLYHRAGQGLSGGLKIIKDIFLAKLT